MDEFLTVAEAVKLTGKNQSTITRFANKHADTEHVKKENNAWLIDKNLLLFYYDAPHSAHNASEPVAAPEPAPVPEPTVPKDEPKQAPTAQEKADDEARREDLIIRTLKAQNSHYMNLFKSAAENSDKKVIENLEDQVRHLKHQLDKKDIQIANFQERTRELHHLLNNQAKLLEGIKEAQQQAPATRQQQGSNKASTSSNTLVWVALAAVAVLLLLAILFVDELRALAT